MSQGRLLAWAGSAGLHIDAGAALLLALPERAPEAEPVMLLEMPMAETTAAPQPEAEAEPKAAPQPEAAPEPPPPEPPTPEPPPEPPPPESPPVEPPAPAAAEPPPPSPQPEDIAAELPPPPPPAPREPPRPAPRRPAPHRAATPAPQVAEPHPAPPVAAASPAPAAPVPAASAMPSASYVARLLGALERQKHYPDAARWRRAQGVALLRFRMRRDGTVIGYRIERSAGDPALDEAVLAMIQRASPLPAPPPELQPGQEAIELTVPIRFALR
ncbi:MAG: energy transducer TonB [Acetobacteraceae bacterium]|nr:energy transducer TonB [Acetobacteraceae bacterium]